VTAWTCPSCDRRFGRTNRPHACVAGMPIEVWLAERTDPQRRAAEAVLAIARRYRGLVIEAVGVGVLIKRARTIVELRPKARWLDLSFISSATIASPRIARTLEVSAGYVYFVHLADWGDVDAELRGWLAAVFRTRSSASRTSRRPEVTRRALEIRCPRRSALPRSR